MLASSAAIWVFRVRRTRHEGARWWRRGRRRRCRWCRGGRARSRGVQHGGVGAAAVADLGQPGGESLGREPVGLGLGGEPLQERQADRGVDGGEQARGGRGTRSAGGRGAGWRRRPGARPGRGGPARWCAARWSRRCRGPGAQPAPVGADHVGQDVGVEPVVLVAGRPVARAQVLDLAGRDHQHRQPGLEQRVDDGSVAAFDADLARRRRSSSRRTSCFSPAASWATVNRSRTSPSASRMQTAWSSLAQSTPAQTRAGTAVRGDTHGCFLAVRAVRETPGGPGTPQPVAH